MYETPKLEIVELMYVDIVTSSTLMWEDNPEAPEDSDKWSNLF